MRAMREFFLRNKNIIAIFSIMSICLLSLLFVYVVEVRPQSRVTPYETYINADADKNANEIISGIEIKQTFLAKQNISGVKIKFDNLEHENSGQITVTLVNENDAKLEKEWKFDASEINEVRYYEFILDEPIRNSNEEAEFSIKFTSNNKTIGKSPTINISDNDNYKEGTLYINGNAQSSDMCLKTISPSSPFLNWIFISIAIVLTIFSGILYYITIIKKLPIEKIFLISATILGLIYMVVMTPYSVSDESGHINTAYRYSNILMGNGYQTDTGNMLKRVEDTKTYGFSKVPSATTYNIVLTHFFDRADESKLVEVPGERIGNVWQYIPTGAGITVARFLKVGYIPLIYIGRIFNFAFFLGMIYLGMRKLPFGKITLFVVSMLPMALHQGASFSYDAIVYGVAYFFISYALHIAFSEERIKKRDLVLLALSGGVLSTCKAGIFIFICFACLVIPKEKFKNKKSYVAMIIGVIGCALAMLLIFNLVKVTKAVTITERPLVEFNSQVAYSYSYIFKNPLSFLKIVYNTIKTYADFYLLSTFGESLAWSTIAPVKVATSIIVGYIVLLIFSAFRLDDEKQYLKIKNKVLFLAIALGLFFAFLTVALTWTPYGDTVIFGLQGRYFLGILPLVAFLFRNNTITLKKSLDKQIILSVGLLQIITLTSVFVEIINM